MATDRIVLKTGIWHPKEVKPIYRPDGDNKIILCCQLFDGIKCVTYDDLRPDGTIIGCHLSWHNEKWKKKYAMKWEHVIVDYWAWVTDIIPI